jgi:hypothetical protein
MALARGLVVPLTDQQRVKRALYLAGELPITALDVFVRKENAPEVCPVLFYRLDYPNGGEDPTAPDPAARWSKPKTTFVNRTLDCQAAKAWIQGYDRYQPIRAVHVWGGRLNCDSELIEAEHHGKCFEILDAPIPGCFVNYGSVDYDHDGDRDRVGHTETVIEVPPVWDPENPDCWRALQTVGARGVSGRTNQRYNGLAFFGNDKHGVPKNARFLRSIMRP